MTISRTGFLFNFAYWFTDPYERPRQVNLCPFFWRCMATLFIKMPLWWLVWAPIGTVVGFLGAARPKFFSTDNYTPAFGQWNNPFSCFTPYKSWHKLINKLDLPLCLPFIPLFWIPIGMLIFNFATNADMRLAVAIVLMIMGCVAVFILMLMGARVATPVVIHKVASTAASTETVQVAREWIKANKLKYCPIIKVV